MTCTGVLHKFVDNRATAVLAPYLSLVRRSWAGPGNLQLNELFEFNFFEVG